MKNDVNAIDKKIESSNKELPNIIWLFLFTNGAFNLFKNLFMLDFNFSFFFILNDISKIQIEIIIILLINYNFTIKLLIIMKIKLRPLLNLQNI
jgi:hypothetical protein